LVNTGTGFSLSLSEKPNYDCIFWEASGCTVYEDRPIQCSTFPFWSSLLDSRQAWKDGGADCPGMDRGELRTREYIEERLWLRRANPTIILDADMARRPEDLDADTILGS
jgi:Fe-S-cluster containining protein